jgi:hypothetical protein
LKSDFAVRDSLKCRSLPASILTSGGQFREYDVASDDQHFVMISGGAAQSTLVGVQNVFQRLLYERPTQR